MNDNYTEIFIATSKSCEWRGCNYANFSKPEELDEYQIIRNIAAVGIFNVANASMTIHCTYDTTNNQYKMQYIYYIDDFYDFTLLRDAYIQDALGIARSYELFGVCPGTYIWEKGKAGYIIPGE